MIFFILTREGLEQIRQHAGTTEPVLWVNQGVLTDTESGELAGQGRNVTVMTNRIDPRSQAAIDGVLDLIRAKHAGEIIWVEHPADAGSGNFRGSSAGALPAAVKKAWATPTLPASASPSWRQALRSVLSQLDTVSDRVRHYLHHNDASPPGLTVIPYHGYATANNIAVSGRVLRNHVAPIAQPDDTRWRNFRALVGMMKSDEVAGARVRARFGAAEHEALTNKEGFFHLDIPLTAPLTPQSSHDVALELIEPMPADGVPVTAVASISLPPASARFGIISDIDDTVLWTNVTNRLNMLLMLAGSNVHTRKPFRGVAAFYAALRDGATGNECNPIFYVSSSPWNLYTPLTEFMRLQDIPLGPLFLKDIGDHTLFGASEHHSHKLGAIERILDAYPHLPFVLIGDSGEQDPEIYSRVVHDYPQRVRVIYIRNINPDPSRIDAIDHLIDEVGKSGAQLVLAPDSEFAAAHAAGEGLIRFEALSEVRAAKRDDSERNFAS